MANRITNLIILKDQKIALVEIHNNTLESIKKEGEIFFDAEKGFWEWWENSAEYMQGDAVDMAFVWDTPSPLITESAFYEPSKKDTQWNQENILEALSLVGLENLQLLHGDCEADQKNVLFTNIEITSIEITSKSIVPRTPIKKHNPKEIEIPEKRAQETEAQKHYREMIEKEERERQNKINE